MTGISASISEVTEMSEAFSEVLERLERIEMVLEQLRNQKMVKDWYTPAEAAELVGKAEFTVREWCRLERIAAKKRPCGRGDSQEWMISHAELQRYLNEGLRPNPWGYRNGR